jgi:hypothetical protein
MDASDLINTLPSTLQGGGRPHMVSPRTKGTLTMSARQWWRTNCHATRRRSFASGPFSTRTGSYSEASGPRAPASRHRPKRPTVIGQIRTAWPSTRMTTMRRARPRGAPVVCHAAMHQSKLWVKRRVAVRAHSVSHSARSARKRSASVTISKAGSIAKTRSFVARGSGGHWHPDRHNAAHSDQLLAAGKRRAW